MKTEGNGIKQINAWNKDWSFEYMELSLSRQALGLFLNLFAWADLQANGRILHRQ